MQPLELPCRFEDREIAIRRFPLPHPHPHMIKFSPLSAAGLLAMSGRVRRIVGFSVAALTEEAARQMNLRV